MSEVILEMKHITKAFSGVKALDDVNLQVKRGRESSALCGENGAGKSTLMNVLSGVYPYGSYEGDIIYKGETCKFHKIKDSGKQGYSYHSPGTGIKPLSVNCRKCFYGQRTCFHERCH